MKILFLIPSFGIGGAEKQIVLLSNFLYNSGFQISIIYRRDGPLREKINSGVKFYKINDLPSINPISFFQITRLKKKAFIMVKLLS